MKLITIDPLKLERKKGNANLQMSIKNGVINFSPMLLAMMDINIGSRINFLQDEENPTNWYLCKATSSGFELRGKNTSSSNCVAVLQCIPLVRKIFNSIDFLKNTGKCLVGTEPININGIPHYEIITASFK